MSVDPVAQQSANQPLSGWHILTTRAGKQSGGLANPLRDLGAKVTEVPTIEIKPPESYQPLDNAIKNVAGYQWLIVTSVNGVDAVFERLGELKMTVDQLKHLQVAAIGPATRKAVEARGLKVVVTPEKYIAESVIEGLTGKLEGKRVLLARAKVARDVLPNELRRAGVQLDVVEAYETVVPAGAQAKLKSVFSARSRRPDIVTFTSSSTATNFLSLLGEGNRKVLRDVLVASIGPVTSATLSRAGFPPAIEAREYTMQGLVLAITEHAHKVATQHLMRRLLGPK